MSAFEQSALELGMRPVDLVFRFETKAGPNQTATERAMAWCIYHGMSVGRMQRDEPRGILFGDYEIQKWRNLNAGERAALHGVFRRVSDLAVHVELRAVPKDLVIRHPDAPAPREGETPYMPAAPAAVQIDSDDRLSARRLATAQVLAALVKSMKVEYGEGASGYYEAHLAFGLSAALVELAEGALRPQLQVLLEAELPGMVEDFFLRAEAVLEAAAGELQS